MTFESILGPLPIVDAPAPREPDDDAFHDLNLDRVLAAVLEGRKEYDLAPLFRTPLATAAAVRFRHAVLRDLERPAVREAVERFANGARTVRTQLAQADKLSNELQRASWIVDAVKSYLDAVHALRRDLAELEVSSEGFRGLRDYLGTYEGSEAFRTLERETETLRQELGRLTYTLEIKGKRVTVRPYDGEADYSLEIDATFQRFQRAATSDHLARLRDPAEMNGVEESILELIAGLFRPLFESLRTFPSRHRDFLETAIRRFDREVQFYLAYLELMTRLRAAGLEFCYPEIANPSKEIRVRETFDLALAIQLVRAGTAVVRNDLRLTDPERIFVVTGPNQGGKTTFARTVGQLHCLARLGLPVPGAEARLYLCDRVLTHFEREERIETLRGKLQDELVRLRTVLRSAGRDSLVIVNESFATTTVNDARFLGTEILNRITAQDAICVYVTFLDELSRLGPSTASWVSEVRPEDPTIRTFKVVPRPADGRAFALAIAEKYGLTYEALRRRIGS